VCQYPHYPDPQIQRKPLPFPPYSSLHLRYVEGEKQIARIPKIRGPDDLIWRVGCRKSTNQRRFQPTRGKQKYLKLVWTRGLGTLPPLETPEKEERGRKVEEYSNASLSIGEREEGGVMAGDFVCGHRVPWHRLTCAFVACNRRYLKSWVGNSSEGPF
jgi:hypothetical protein